MGRATWYNDTEEPLPTGPYIIALPYASQSRNLFNTAVVLRKTQTEITSHVSYPGPMVPLSPHYPPDDQNWNHYWGAGGWPPLAVALDGKMRAEPEGFEPRHWFNEQIIDLDNLTKDGEGESAASKMGIYPAGDGILDWRF